MPLITDYKCNKCDFGFFEVCEGGYMYATDDNGKRHILCHPCEGDDAKRIIGEKFVKMSQKEKSERIGFIEDCVCLSCLKKFSLDLNRDKRECSFCHSSKVKTADQMIGKKCPKCKKGIIEEKMEGMYIT